MTLARPLWARASARSVPSETYQGWGLTARLTASRCELHFFKAMRAILSVLWVMACLFRCHDCMWGPLGYNQ
eukprot:9028652-Pyramimonas_sp.AAC.1